MCLSHPLTLLQDIAKKNSMHGVSLEDALTFTGFGRFQKSMALVGGLCWMACGFQNSLNAYILPSVRCDMNVSSSMMGFFNAMFLAGGLSSCFLWGALVESVGRWPVLVFGMSSDALLAFLSSTSQNFYLLLGFRFLNGFVVGGPAAIIPAYVGEFMPVDKRRVVLCYLGFFWTSSWVILPAIAWLVIPQEWVLVWGEWKYNSWRLLILMAGCPSLLSAIIIYNYPESPKFLLAQGRDDEALDVLAQVYATNTGEIPSNYPIKSLMIVGKGNSPKAEPKSIITPLMNMLRQCRSLLVMPVLPITLLGMYLFFANMFGYYGLGLWLPELVHRFEEHYTTSNTTVSVCQLKPKAATPLSENPCLISSTVFTHSLIIGSMGILGNFLSGFLSARLSRPVLPALFMTGAGLSVLALYFVTSSFQNMMVSSIFQLCIGTANMVYNSIIVDMFPPEICGLAVCLLVMLGRLGAMMSNLTFGHLLDNSCTVPILLCAAIIIMGAILSWRLPKNPYGENGEMDSEEKEKKPNL